MGNYRSLSQILLMFTAPLQFQQHFLVYCTCNVSAKKKKHSSRKIISGASPSVSGSAIFRIH